MKNKISQWLIDFGEDRMNTCQRFGERRAIKYGNKSWQWQITILQEMLWFKFSCFALEKI